MRPQDSRREGRVVFSLTRCFDLSFALCLTLDSCQVTHPEHERNSSRVPLYHSIFGAKYLRRLPRERATKNGFSLGYSKLIIVLAPPPHLHVQRKFVQARAMMHAIASHVALIALLLPSTCAKRIERQLAFGLPAPKRLKLLLESETKGARKSDKPILLPCCYDGLSAKLVARAGFDATFMTGFGVSGEQPDVERNSMYE